MFRLIHVVCVFALAATSAASQRPRIEYGEFLDIPCTESGVVKVFVDTGTNLSRRQVLADELFNLRSISKGEFVFFVVDTLDEADVVLAFATRLDVYASPRLVAADPKAGIYTDKGVGYVLLPGGRDAIRLIAQFRARTKSEPSLLRMFARDFAHRFIAANHDRFNQILFGTKRPCAGRR